MLSCFASTMLGDGVKWGKSRKVCECFPFPLLPLHLPSTLDGSFGEQQRKKQ